jgi:hypothetical protein
MPKIPYRDIIEFLQENGLDEEHFSVSFGITSTTITTWNLFEGDAQKRQSLKRLFGPLYPAGDETFRYLKGVHTQPEHTFHLSWYGTWKCEITGTQEVVDALTAEQIEQRKASIRQMLEEVEEGKTTKVKNLYRCVSAQADEPAQGGEIPF